MPEAKVWFITGCSSGFGLCITEHALQKGDKVVATLRKPDVLSDLAAKHPDRLLVLKLDVVQPNEIIAAFAAAKDRFGRIDVVVNNAGILVVGEVECTSDRNARSLFEVNFWGASHVSREAIRFFREENDEPIGGRLIQVSSMAGVKSGPCVAYYCASKFALEALSEGLAAELNPDWNIKITIIEPGMFYTKCPTTNATFEPIHPAYADPTSPTTHYRDFFANLGPMLKGDPAKFAEVVRRVACLEDPPLRLPILGETLDCMRQMGRHYLETADKWESWSEDMLLKE